MLTPESRQLNWLFLNPFPCVYSYIQDLSNVFLTQLSDFEHQLVSSSKQKPKREKEINVKTKIIFILPPKHQSSLRILSCPLVQNPLYHLHDHLLMPVWLLLHAPKNLSRRQKEYCLAKVMTKYSCLTKNTILENHYLCHINGNIMRFSGSLDPWILFKLGL